MPKLIDADALAKRLIKLGFFPAIVKRAIEEAPAVAPVVHGKWRFCGSDRWNDAYECSECGKMAMDNSKYCPNCGAKMDGGEHD